MLALKEKDLLRQAMLIDGAWVQADSGRTFDVCNPATGELVARVPDGGAAETRRAIAAAERAGLPPGVCNVVTGSARAIGGELTSNPMVRKLSFTGSTNAARESSYPAKTRRHAKSPPLTFANKATKPSRFLATSLPKPNWKCSSQVRGQAAYDRN